MIRPGTLCFAAMLIMLVVGTACAQTTEFTYQGSLKNGPAAANGNYDFEFALFDALTGGSQIGSTVTANSVAVTNGTFSAKLDFGSQFPGADRFLEIRVRPTGQPGITILGPRQLINSAPYSVKAINADNATNATNAGNVTGVVAVANGGTGSTTKNFVDLTTNQSIGGNKTFTGTVSGNGSQLTNLNGANITNNTINASALAPDIFPNSHNLSLLGSLRWDLLGQRVSVGSNASHAAFDGSNIWVANFASNNVTEFRASDGSVLGTFPAGTGPNYVAFDGANIWVTNTTSSNVQNCGPATEPASAPARLRLALLQKASHLMGRMSGWRIPPATL